MASKATFVNFVVDSYFYPDLDSKMNKEFEFKKLIKGKGFFCKISYEFDTIESLILNFDCQIDTKWYGALLCGTNYFYEKYGLSKNNGIKIII